MTAQLIQFPGGRYAMAHKTIPQAQANPLRALPRGFDSRDDSYRITIPAKLALEAFCLAGMVVLILFTCFVVL